jgi:SanA protein
MPASAYVGIEMIDLRTWLKRGLLLCLVGSMLVAGLTWNAVRLVFQASDSRIVSVAHARPASAAIVLGCRVNGETVSGCLEERLATALELYTTGRVKRLLLSGDHGTRGYDEVNAMMDWLVAHGVPQAHIFLDHAGFDTHDTMVRARQVFAVTDAAVVSQRFHLPRAVYLARAAGIEATGVQADPPGGSVCRGSRVREPLACLKAWIDVSIGSGPRHLGPSIPITGSPCASYDRPSDKARCR